MWNLIDSNKRIGTFIKVKNDQNQVESYKNHVKNLRNIKPQININNPWKPSFSLSKRKNKY